MLPIFYMVEVEILTIPYNRSVARLHEKHIMERTCRLTSNTLGTLWGGGALFLLTYSVQRHNETSHGDGRPNQTLEAFLKSLPASQ